MNPTIFAFVLYLVVAEPNSGATRHIAPVPNLDLPIGECLAAAKDIKLNDPWQDGILVGAYCRPVKLGERS